MHRLIFILSLFTVTLSQTIGQTSEFWTLEKCISHAMEKNLDLKISRNQYQKAVYNHRQSAWSMSPEVGAFANSNVNFQRATNQDYQIETGTTYTVNYGVGASINLFAGFTTHNITAASRFYKLAVGESTKLSEYILELEITGLFSRALYQKALADVFREKLEISLRESERIAATIEAGQLEPVAQNEINAAVSANRLELSRAENEYKLLKLQLAQIIEVPDVYSFEISDAGLESAIPVNIYNNVDSLYTLTNLVYPAVQQREFELEYYKKMHQVSKGNYSPTLTMRGGYTSEFYSADKTDTGKETPFSTQFDKYRNPYLGLSLNVPLFVGRKRDFQTKKSRIDLENAMYSLENQKKQLRRELEEAVFKLEAHFIEYTTAVHNLEFAEKSFETYREKFSLGLINTTDFMTAQNQYALARANVMLARYSWILQKKTVELYCNGR